jgi:hypothetical protein
VSAPRGGEQVVFVGSSESECPAILGQARGGVQMKWQVLAALIVGLALLAGEAWAIVGADTGAVWVQATTKDKIELTNIISFELGGSPEMYQNCLDKMFQDPANLNKQIIEVAKECRAKNPR